MLENFERNPRNFQLELDLQSKPEQLDAYSIQDYVYEVLAKGAQKAREVATVVNQRAKRACGLD